MRVPSFEPQYDDLPINDRYDLWKSFELDGGAQIGVAIEMERWEVWTDLLKFRRGIQRRQIAVGVILHDNSANLHYVYHHLRLISAGGLAPTAADLAATASRLEAVIADGEPEQAKALLRILIAELRVNGRHDIQPTYRVIAPDRALTAGVCATSGKVETAGVEPASAVA